MYPYNCDILFLFFYLYEYYQSIYPTTVLLTLNLLTGQL